MTPPASSTIPALLQEMAARHPGRPALADEAGTLTYAELRDAVTAFAKGLVRLGVDRGSRVAILMPNRIEWVVADLAICSLGAVSIAINTWATSRELAYLLRHSDAEILIMEGRYLSYDYVAMLQELAPLANTTPLLRRIVHVGEHSVPDSMTLASMIAGGADVTDQTLEDAAAAIDAGDVAKILYTSGSTSTPKGVQLCHGHLIENMWHLGNRMHVTEQDRFWLAVSLFWGFGSENALFNALTHGSCVVLQNRFDPLAAMQAIEREKCTVFYCTPNMVKAIMKHPDRADHDLTSLRAGGMPGTVKELQEAVELGVTEISHIYGQTESYGNCALTDARLDPPEKRFASVGRMLPGFDLRIVDPYTLEPRAAGVAGEIQIKGRVTPGYYKDEDKNLEAFTEDGFYRTGDLGSVDEEGYLYFRGRIKEMIKSGGINIAPAEIEEVLGSHPGVKSAYVVGLPDAERDEIVAAVVVASQPLLGEGELLKYCRQNLAAYKLPRRFRFVAEEDIPLTTTNKVQKTRLAALFSD